ncbi:MAG: hypothetical protein WCA49_10230 [Candidatus Sulfotelmatobacter sp.]
MKSGLYTNCLLTVIAASLLYLCATHVAQPPSARAADYSVPVIVNGSPDGGTTAVPVVVFEAKVKDGHWEFSTKP